MTKPHSRILHTVLLFTVAFLGSSAYGGLLTGKVYEDHTGDPLAAVRVRIVSLATGQSAADVATRSSGEFISPDLPPGEYRLEFSKSNYIATRIRTTIPAVSDSALYVRLVRLGVITGHVWDATGKSVDGVSVSAFSRSADGRPRPHGSGSRVNRQGEYRIHSLPPGEYVVAAYRYQGAARSIYSIGDEPRFVEIEGGAELGGVNLLWDQGASFEIGGQIAGGGSQARYALTLASRRYPAISPARGFTRPGGEFVFSGVPRGSYVLLASGRSMGGQEEGVKRLYGRVDIEVVDSDVEGLSLDLEPGTSLQVELAVSAMALASGACPQSLSVNLRSHDPWFGGRDTRLRLSAGEPRIVGNLAPGAYEISPFDLPPSCLVTHPPRADARDESGLLRVELVAAGRIEGRLLTNAGETPALTVVLAPRDPSVGGPPLRFAAVDAQRHFVFDELQPGWYQILAVPRSSLTQSRWRPDVSRMAEVEVFAGHEPTRIDLPSRVVE